MRIRSNAGPALRHCFTQARCWDSVGEEGFAMSTNLTRGAEDFRHHGISAGGTAGIASPTDSGRARGKLVRRPLL